MGDKKTIIKYRIGEQNKKSPDRWADEHYWNDYGYAKIYFTDEELNADFYDNFMQALNGVKKHINRYGIGLYDEYSINETEFVYDEELSSWELSGADSESYIIFDLNCSSNHYGEERGMMYLNDSLNLDSNLGIKVEEKAIANNMENLSNWHSYVYMGIDKKEDVSVIPLCKASSNEQAVVGDWDYLPDYKDLFEKLEEQGKIDTFRLNSTKLEYYEHYNNLDSLSIAKFVEYDDYTTEFYLMDNGIGYCELIQEYNLDIDNCLIDENDYDELIRDIIQDWTKQAKEEYGEEYFEEEELEL